MSLNNVDIAILTKLNELAERYGLKASDFLAIIKDQNDKTVLTFELPATGNALREERFEKMLQALRTSGDGVNEDIVLKAKYSEIIERLDSALQCAPRPRSSFL